MPARIFGGSPNLAIRMEPHSIFVVIIPSLIAAVVLVSKRNAVRDNGQVFLISIALSALQGRPEIQSVYAIAGYGQELTAHGLPIFLVLYLVFGRFAAPSAFVAWSGTFISLMVTDLAFSYFLWASGSNELEYLLSGIGGGRWHDGLVVLPISAAAVIAFVRYRLAHGDSFGFMMGQRLHLARMAGKSIPRDSVVHQ